MSKHTPGPWKAAVAKFVTFSGIGIGESLLVTTSLEDDSPDIALIRAVRDGLREQDKANARLIAAAPELLEALKREHILINHAISWGVEFCERGDCPVCQLIRRAGG